MKQYKTALLAMGAAIICSCAQENTYKTDMLGISVTPSENREYSYTDKKAGYWYGTTHQEELQWYSGWNMAKKRILADYTISVDGKILDRSEAECTVFPERLERRWSNALETFRMVDNLPIIHIGVQTDAAETSLALDRTLIADTYNADGYEFFIPAEAPDKRIMLAEDGAKGFVLTYGTEEECHTLLSEFLANGDTLM